mmetsp:Transcript_34955/g.78749  ORF Transcript_34955/g.78749 Transcript_34955/m.78749 type:complete len:316 (+) Transcript_34955:136-1083(+)
MENSNSRRLCLCFPEGEGYRIAVPLASGGTGGPPSSAPRNPKQKSADPLELNFPGRWEIASAPASLPQPARRDEEEHPPGVDGSAEKVPDQMVLPSDRAARHRALRERLRGAYEIAAEGSAAPMAHGRCCMAGLSLLELIRVTAWMQGTVPGYTVFGMHFLTTASDFACILCALPVFLCGIRGRCVQLGCLGPSLTLVFAMSLVDLSALGVYLLVATPRPLAPGSKTYFDVLEACVGVWEFALIASVALQVALCCSSWRIYRCLRRTGLYPPGAPAAEVGKAVEDISVLEVMCEAEDAKLISDCVVSGSTGCCRV